MNLSKKYIPALLLYSRLLIAFAIFIFSFTKNFHTAYIVLSLIYTGILTDIFDGIIARNIKISTSKFRVHDTIIDLFFYFSILFYVYFKKNAVINNNIILIISILILELSMYLISLIKFGKLPSPHAVLSKFWGLYLITEFSLLILNVPGNHFRIALIIGLFVHLDRVLIYFFIKKWEHDVPSSVHAYKLRKGKQIVRKKIFNG